MQEAVDTRLSANIERTESSAGAVAVAAANEAAAAAGGTIEIEIGGRLSASVVWLTPRCSDRFCFILDADHDHRAADAAMVAHSGDRAAGGFSPGHG